MKSLATMKLSVFAALSLTLIGCDAMPTPSADSKKNDDSSRTRDTQSSFEYATEMQAKESARFSIPALDPKPVIWQEDWAGEEPVSEARKRASGLMQMADMLKSMEKFEGAREFYDKALEADPSWSYPVYQSACNYELWNKHTSAQEQFSKAVEMGFSDFPTALSDSELGQIREGSDFERSLLKIRDRYIATASSRVGQPIAIGPKGQKPKDGWPVMLLLHGYGDTNLSFLENAERWADLGFIAVAVPGSVPARDGRFVWSNQSTDPTHRDLQQIVKSPLFNEVADRKKVYLLGFSQGALHAMLLTARFPDEYAGVVAISPGGSLANQLANPPVNKAGRAASCVFIHGDQEPHAPYVKIWAEACTSAGWKFKSQTHQGTHHFPEDWEDIRPGIAEFLLE